MMEVQENISVVPIKNNVTPDLVLEWRKYYLREGHTVHSTTTYFNYIKRFVDYGIEINQKSVDRFRNKNTSGACSGALKNFFQFLVNKKEFPKEIQYIHFDRSKSTKKFPNSISAVEVNKLIENIQGIKEKYLIKITYELGLRISESLKLKWEDFNWSNWILDKSKQGEVNIKITKRDKFRTIPVSSEMMNMLYSTHENKTSLGIPIGNLLFDFGIDNYINRKEFTNEENIFDYIVYAENYVRTLLYKVSKEVLNKRINPHQLRHGKAQFLMNQGMPIESIKRFLGHERISSTEIYAQASAEKLKKDLEIYDKTNN